MRWPPKTLERTPACRIQGLQVVAGCRLDYRVGGLFAKPVFLGSVSCARVLREPLVEVPVRRSAPRLALGEPLRPEGMDGLMGQDGQIATLVDRVPHEMEAIHIDVRG